MEYFFYCRDNADTARLRDEIVESHWSFMDTYADAMIARGPTLTDDRETATGSMHIVDLPDAEAVRVFAYEEPNYRAGVYREVMVRRWRNELGSTMWDFAADPTNSQQFLIIANGHPGRTPDEALRAEQRRYFTDRGVTDRFIARGPLLSDDGTAWTGNAWLIELPDRTAAETMLADEPYTRAGLYAEIEIHPWQFGGRPA